MWQPRRAGFLLMDEGNLWKGRMAKTEMATSKNPQHFPPPPPPPPSLYGRSSSSNQGGGVLCVCKTMYSVTSVLL